MFLAFDHFDSLQVLLLWNFFFLSLQVRASSYNSNKSTS